MPVEPDLSPEDQRSPSMGAGSSAWGSACAALRSRADILAVIAAGGALGSCARYAVAQWLPTDPTRVPWSTFSVNVVGSLLLGALMGLVLDVWPPSRYLRPFLGVGVLGGFTTFSTYMVDTWSLLRLGEGARAAGYLAGTLVAGLFAVWAGITAARRAARPFQRRQHRAHERRAQPAQQAPGEAVGDTIDRPDGARPGAPKHTTRSTR